MPTRGCYILEKHRVCNLRHHHVLLVSSNWWECFSAFDSHSCLNNRYLIDTDNKIEKGDICFRSIHLILFVRSTQSWIKLICVVKGCAYFRPKELDRNGTFLRLFGNSTKSFPPVDTPTMMSSADPENCKPNTWCPITLLA